MFLVVEKNLHKHGENMQTPETKGPSCLGIEPSCCEARAPCDPAQWLKPVPTIVTVIYLDTWRKKWVQQSVNNSYGFKCLHSKKYNLTLIYL